MKKILSILLAAALCAGLVVPAAATTPPAGDMEQSLTEVTSLVKATLSVDDDYTEFYGDYYEKPVPQWSLNWSDDDRSLSVTCDEDGKVMDVYAYTYIDNSDRFYGFDPAFPAVTGEETRAMAEELLERLMGEKETARIDSVSSSLGEDASYRYNGTILVNGLESPITFSLRIDKNGLRSFSRSDGYGTYVGEIPGTDTAVTEKAAADALFETVETELYYVLDEQTGEAKLHYVPVGAYTVVDGATGETVDMDALYASFLEQDGVGYAVKEADAEAPMALDMAAGAANLSEMELESIANYGDAMTQEELDAALRTMAALGITDAFSLQRCSYTMDSETGDITASLRYTAEMTEKNLYGYSEEEFRQYQSWGNSLTIYKYITINAKTGELMSVSTSYPLWEKGEDAGLRETELRKNAENFLALYAGEMFPETDLCTLRGYEQGSAMTYARMANGYFYPENYLYVKLNPVMGTVDEYSFVWEEDVTFAPADDIVTEAEAKVVYAGALDVIFGYVAWPEEVRRDDPELLRYIEWGYTWVESLRTAWYYGGTESVTAVDAHTGEVIVRGEKENGVYAYTDLNKDEQTAVEALGQAGIGFAGGRFEGERILTLRDAVTLLLQAAGYDPSDWDEDTLRREAVYQGFVTEEQWSPDETVSRMAFLRMLLGPSRYGDAAELTGIWDTAFTDTDGDDTGYAALAEGLGLVSGKKLEPREGCTRSAAAGMLYAFMSR